MSFFSGPSTVNTDLIFGYDLGAVGRSYFGGFATNEMTRMYGYEVAPWTVNGTNTDVSDTVVGKTAPVPNAKTWKFVKTGTSSQWNGWEGGYGNIWTGLSGDYWTTSFWYKTSDPAGITAFSVGGFYTSNWSRPYNYTIIDSNASIIADGQWHYAYVVTRFDEDYDQAIIADGPSWGYSGESGELYINGLQWTKTAYPTQFISSKKQIRRRHECVVDYTKNTLIDTENAKFATDGSLIFDGATSVLTVDHNDVFNSQTITMEAWVKPTTVNQDGFIFEKGSLNTQYSMFFWSGGSFIFRTKGLSTEDLTFTQSSYITAGAWNHIVCTHQPGTKRIYVNGNLVAEQTGLTGTISTNNAGISIGAYGGVSTITPTKWINPSTLSSTYGDGMYSVNNWNMSGNTYDAFSNGDYGYFTLYFPFNIKFFNTAGTSVIDYGTINFHIDGYISFGENPETSLLSRMRYASEDNYCDWYYTLYDPNSGRYYVRPATSTWYNYNANWPIFCFYNGKPYFDIYIPYFVTAQAETSNRYHINAYSVRNNPYSYTYIDRFPQRYLTLSDRWYTSEYESDSSNINSTNNVVVDSSGSIDIAYRITPLSGSSRAYYFNGKIDVMRVYNRALTADEVKQNFTALRYRFGL